MLVFPQTLSSGVFYFVFCLGTPHLLLSFPSQVPCPSFFSPDPSCPACPPLFLSQSLCPSESDLNPSYPHCSASTHGLPKSQNLVNTRPPPEPIGGKFYVIRSQLGQDGLWNRVCASSGCPQSETVMGGSRAAPPILHKDPRQPGSP